MTFDSPLLSRVVEALQMLVGGRVQRLAQPQQHAIVLSIWRREIGEKHLLLDCSPRFYRAHLIETRLPNPATPPAFCLALRKYLDGAQVLAIEQRETDRILDLRLENGGENYLLTAELMGKYSNLILVAPDHRVLHAAKLIPARLSRVREILPGHPYLPPPPPAFASDAARSHTEFGRANIHVALEEYYAAMVERAAFEQEKSTLRGELKKALKQKQQALEQVRRGARESERADEFQKWGELLLAHLHELENGASEAELPDYFSNDGATIGIALDAQLSPTENAARYFQKAKKARERRGELSALEAKMSGEAASLEELLRETETATASETLRQVRERARAGGALRLTNESESTRAAPNKAAFDGKKVRVLTSPDGFQVLVGENAEANDYLVTRVAHSNDWWLHLRAATSAHAIVKTHNAPDRVPLSTLLFAARLVVARSPAKHAGWAEVDYTLRKYVRKPRKAPPGSVVISHQKTLRVEPSKSGAG